MLAVWASNVSPFKTTITKGLQSGGTHLYTFELSSLLSKVWVAFGSCSPLLWSFGIVELFYNLGTKIEILSNGHTSSSPPTPSRPGFA